MFSTLDALSAVVMYKVIPVETLLVWALSHCCLQIERAKYNILEGALLLAYAKLELHWPIVMMTIIANLCMTESVCASATS